MSSNPPARLEKLRGPVMIVKTQKSSKIFENFENNRKFQQTLAKNQDIKIFKTILLSQDTIQYTYFRL